jgi:hypothetical protein
MDYKKVRFNSAKLEFREEQRGSLTILTARNPELKAVVRTPTFESRGFLCEFVGTKHTYVYQVEPVGDTGINALIALAQCFFVSKHFDHVGDLVQLCYTHLGEIYRHTFERDPKYDQPILIYLDQLNAKE